ncbi:MAG: DNA methyltransferase [Patescibacteria group bacterium]
MRHFAIFGSHPRLSLAEFKAVKPSLAAPILSGAAGLFDDPDWDGALLMNKLGGTVKLGDIHDECPVAELSADHIAQLFLNTPRADRIVFGLTIYGGTPAAKKRFAKLPLEIKRVLKANDKSVRWVTSENDAPLSPAAVAKLNLTTEGYDGVIAIHGEQAAIGLTTNVQDAEFWGERDFGRPSRDDENGMLPPKLARMMVNLGRINDGDVIIDPFCGSGTVLMEAALATRAKKIIGSDIDSKQVEMTRQNNEWLIQRHILRREDAERFQLFTSDVRRIATHLRDKIDVVVTEGYLGPALRGSESERALEKTAEEITDLWRDSFTALKPLLNKKARLVCIWPAMKTSHGMARIDLTNELDELGYTLENPLEEWDATNGPLLYAREGQRVMRRIVVLKLKK